MNRDRAWRRGQAERKFRRVLKWKSNYFHDSYRYYSRSNAYYGLQYTKRTSNFETIEVIVKCRSHFQDFLEHSSRLARDNPQGCSCSSCRNPRNQGIGNAREVLSHPERNALIKSVQDVAESNACPPNSKWRSRKFGKSTHLI